MGSLKEIMVTLRSLFCAGDAVGLEKQNVVVIDWEGEGKQQCPRQQPNLGWTSPGRSLGQTTQTDLVGYTSEHCIPLGQISSNRTASQLHAVPETKGQGNK